MELYIDKANKQNIQKAYRLETPDKVPVTFSDQLDFLSGWLSLDCDIYHLNAEVTLDAQVKFNKRFRGTGIIGPNFGVAIEPSAFGAGVLFTKTNPPWIIQPCLDYDDLEAYAAGMKVPSPLVDGLLPLFYQTTFFMRKLTGDDIAPMGALAPIDIAALLVGLDNLAMGMKLMPEVIHALFDKITAFLVAFVETKAKLFNVEKLEIMDLYGDYAGYISAADFREFVLPYNKRIYDYFSSEDTVRLYHCDGNLAHLMELLPEMNCNCLYSFDPHTDLSQFVSGIGDKVCLIGNLDPIRILRNGTKEEVFSETKRLLEIGKKAKGFILSTGGELPNGTPPENIDAVFEAVDQYGSYI